jgi:small subunit ribosomal protein S17
MSDNTSVPSERTTSRKVRQGVVVSDVQDKTIVVRVDRRTTHPLYGKSMRVSKKYHVHDETNDAGVGDTVRIVETRPLSKLKRWRLQSIVERAK